MVSDTFEWALQALAQPAKIQIDFFPDFVNAADELALTWEEAIEDLDLQILPVEAQGSIKELDEYMVSISGKGNERIWTSEAIFNSVEWARMRKMAEKTIFDLGWVKQLPKNPPWLIYSSEN